jgi:oryzin
MRYLSVTRIATLAAALLPFAAAAPAARSSLLKIRNAEATDVVANSFIVVYKDTVTSSDLETHLSSVNSLISKRSTPYNGVGATYDMEGFKGFELEADEATVAEIAADPNVCSLIT